MSSGPAAADQVHPSRVPVLRHVFALWRWTRSRLSRRQLSIRLLKLPVSEGTGDQPGLVILQIDGLAHEQLQSALQAGRLPFLRQLLRRENYRLLPMYSGQPSTTPAVLGELFYGIPQAVPAFSFRDHRSGEVVEMVQPEIASVVQGELEAQAEGLLQNGGAYCDIYSGGAGDSHFCPASMGWNALQEAATWRKAAIYALNFAAIFRMVDELVVDLGHALIDVLTSRLGRREFVEEIKFLPRRLIGGVALRDLVSIAAEVDTTRGLPVLHANFVGYDELAHRRGPSSAYAHRGLPAIDRALRRIWNSAQASSRRDYHFWIMADHGQEQTTPYSQLHGRALTDAVAELFRGVTGESTAARGNASPDDSDPSTPLVVAIGPLGYIYWPGPLAPASVADIGERLSRELQIPIVMARLPEGTVAWSEGRRWNLPEDAGQILGHDHPHLAEVSRDFAQLCEHPDAGQFVIGGYRKAAESVSFVSEHGAHGGPGPQETTGFVMLPAADARHAPRQLRPNTLRDMGRALLRGHVPRRTASSVEQTREHESIRIVTYNVHSCIGLDGRLSPTRIARVLAALDPDVVALQELDVCRQRSGCVDQARTIAEALEMDLHFLPCLEVTGEKYGNAVLSRLPMRLIRSERLPGLHSRLEPRGALWVQFDCSSTTLNLLTTHLSFDPRERPRQIDALLGPDWLGHPLCQSPVVLCGDLNAGPRSALYRKLSARLRDVQRVDGVPTPQRTWFSPLPLARIDHIFVSRELTVRECVVGGSTAARVASDHLPVAVELSLPGSESFAGCVDRAVTSRPATV